MERLLCVAGNIPSCHNCPKCHSLNTISFRLSRFGAVFGCSRVDCSHYHQPLLSLAQCVDQWRQWIQRHKMVASGSACCPLPGTLDALWSTLVEGGISSAVIECIPRFRATSPHGVILPNAFLVRVFVMLLSQEVFVTAPDLNVVLGGLTAGLSSNLRKVPFDEVGAAEALTGPLLLIDPLYNELSIMTVNQDMWVLDGIPRCIRKLLNQETCNAQKCEAQRSSQRTPSISNVHPNLWASLLRHQRLGVIRALELRGRVLFGDDMGVGKTLQAIATVQALQAYPTIIVCPAGLRHLWVDAIEAWWPDLGLEDVHVIYGANDKLPQASDALSGGPLMVICSYHMLAALQDDMERRPWACVVVDESHMLRPSLEGPLGDAQYTRAVCNIGRRASHCLMLSGTPSLTAPFGIYLQADTISPGVLGETRFDFAIDYCSITMDPYVTVGACDRVHELRQLLADKVMLRRTKAEVLEDLPPKRRIVVHIAPSLASRGGKKHQRRESNSTVASDSATDDDIELQEHCGTSTADGGRQSQSFPTRYATAWQGHHRDLIAFVVASCKQHAAVREKLVIFAHHIELLHALRDAIAKSLTCSSQPNYSTIYLDGSVPPQTRPGLISAFQTDPMCLVAVVGVTVAAVGISLSAASKCIFAELPPDVAWLQQAEDRLHRPHQVSTVTSLLVVDPTSAVDARLLDALRTSFVATKDVLDGKHGTRLPSHADDTNNTRTFAHETTSNTATVTSPRTLRVCPPAQPRSIHDNVSGHDVLRLQLGRPPRGETVGWNSMEDIVFQLSPETCRLHIAVRDAGGTGEGHRVVYQRVGSVPLEEARILAGLGTQPPSAARWSMSQTVILESLRAFVDAWDSIPWGARQRYWKRRLQHAGPVGWLSVAEMISRANRQLRVRREQRDDVVGDATPERNGTKSAEPSNRQRYHNKWEDRHGPTPVESEQQVLHLPLFDGDVLKGNHAFMVWRMQYQAGAPWVDFPGPAIWGGSMCSYVCGCLNCRSILEPRVSISAGEILLLQVGESDSRMFCSGACRRAYFLTKSSQAIRRTVHEADGGSCSTCGVDCDALVQELATCATIDARRIILDQRHPAFLHDAPTHALRLLRNPCAGYCWHADHVVPVWEGGGSASLSNLQTLCIPCHLLKTKHEAHRRALLPEEEGAPLRSNEPFMGESGVRSIQLIRGTAPRHRVVSTPQ